VDKYPGLTRAKATNIISHLSTSVDFMDEGPGFSKISKSVFWGDSGSFLYLDDAETAGMLASGRVFLHATPGKIINFNNPYSIAALSISGWGIRIVPLVGYINTKLAPITLNVCK
jgi:hypothetical protein